MWDTRYLIFSVFAVMLMPFGILAQDRAPKVGYAYPAGGQKGSSVTVELAGQHLRQMTEAHVSGEGVHVSIVTNMPAYPNNLNREERYLLMDLAMNTIMMRFEESGLSGQQVQKAKDIMIKQWPWNALKEKNLELEGETIPAHFLMMGFENKSVREIMHAMNILFFPNKYRQINRQLAETVVVNAVIDRDAQPGERILWLSSPKMGVSSPIVFQVGDTPERSELEPNDGKSFEHPIHMEDYKQYFLGAPETVPFVMNGQIMPGDIDRFRFKAEKGQKLLIETEARRLIPYLADTVPGWFQAVITLYDSNGKELVFADDHFINPDPVMYYEVVEDGEYELGIRDAIYRGREDFVYRITVRDAPWAGKELVEGSKYGDRWTKRAVIPAGMSEADIIPKDVLALLKVDEAVENNSIKNAQAVKIPVLLDGYISGPGDVDVYKVSVDKASKLAVEVYGRRLGSPVDTVVKVTDKNGNIITINDDYIQKYNQMHIDTQGLITHHADSRLVADLPGKGDFYVHVLDVQKAGGPQYGYRLRISDPMPGFSVIATPSCLSVRQNEHVPVILYAERRDGYNGAIDFEFEDGSAFAVTGGDIPEGELSSVVTVQTKEKGTGEKNRLGMKAVATIADNTVSSEVTAADPVMQAFLYEHLMPVDELTAVVRNEKWGVPLVEPAVSQYVRLKPGSSELLRFKTGWTGSHDKFELVLEHGPEGVTIDPAPVLKDKVFEFNIFVSKECKPREANVVISIWTIKDKVDKDGKRKTDRWCSHRLPAISLSVVNDTSSPDGNVVAGGR